MLSIDIIGLAGACSYALDCIEAELVNIKNKHGKRVAYISIRMAEYWKDRKSTRLNSSHITRSRMPSSA